MLAVLTMAGLANLVGCWQGPPTLQRNGGYVLVYEMEDSAAGAADMDAMAKALRQRLDPQRFRGVTVTPVHGRGLEITLPGVNATQLKKDQGLIESAGHLEFLILARGDVHQTLIAAARQQAAPAGGSEAEADPSAQPPAKPTVSPAAGSFPRPRWLIASDEVAANFPSVIVNQPAQAQGDRQILAIETAGPITAEHIGSVRRILDTQGEPAIEVTLAPQGAKRMQKLTTDHQPLPNGDRYQLAVVLDDRVLVAPSITSAIAGHLQITGLTADQVELLLQVLRQGRLPARVKTPPLTVQQVNPIQ